MNKRNFTSCFHIFIKKIFFALLHLLRVPVKFWVEMLRVGIFALFHILSESIRYFTKAAMVYVCILHQTEDVVFSFQLLWIFIMNGC